MIDFLQVDVFADRPFGGNPLAVFPEPGSLSAGQMQSIAREMNLSETTFVPAAGGDRYDVRIFTPAEELPFAGHPTLGTTYVLSELGMVEGDPITQVSAAGETPVRREGDVLWFTRHGSSSGDFGDVSTVARGLGCSEKDLVLDAGALGGRGQLVPSFADLGFPQLMVPVSDQATLRQLSPVAAVLGSIAHDGAYCFTVTGPAHIEARGFFPSLGIHEDPATGSAAGALGLYLADRVGEIEITIHQGLEIGRPSVIAVRARPGLVDVGGKCELILRGKLEKLPETDR